MKKFKILIILVGFLITGVNVYSKPYYKEKTFSGRVTEKKENDIVEDFYIENGELNGEHKTYRNGELFRIRNYSKGVLKSEKSIKPNSELEVFFLKESFVDKVVFSSRELYYEIIYKDNKPFSFIEKINNILTSKGNISNGVICTVEDVELTETEKYSVSPENSEEFKLYVATQVREIKKSVVRSINQLIKFAENTKSTSEDF